VSSADNSSSRCTLDADEDVRAPSKHLNSDPNLGVAAKACASSRSGRQRIAQGESASPGYAAIPNNQSSRRTRARASGRQRVAQGESASPGYAAIPNNQSSRRTRARASGRQRADVGYTSAHSAARWRGLVKSLRIAYPGLADSQVIRRGSSVRLDFVDFSSP
jgi:hypothetical protein